MSSVISVHITASSGAEASKIAKALLAEKLAACINILPEVHSIYRWQGKVEESSEVMLIVKTRAELFESVRKLVKALHSYDCPCIVALPIVNGHQPWLDWVIKETTP